MSDLLERVQSAMTASRKAQAKDRTLVLGTVLANLKNREIELKRPLTDEDAVEVLRRGVKTRRESVEQYEKAGRLDLSAVEQGEIKVIEEFLPADVDPEEIRAAVRVGDRRRGRRHRQGHGAGHAGLSRKGRRQGDQPDRARGAAARVSHSQVQSAIDGVPSRSAAGTPSRLPGAAIDAALADLEFEEVLAAVAGLRGGAARCRPRARAAAHRGPRLDPGRTGAGR